MSGSAQQSPKKETNANDKIKQYLFVFIMIKFP